MLNTLRHLLPDSTAWRLVIERLLKKYLRGLSTVGADARSFIDDVSDDVWPQTTRQLSEWQRQFGLEAWGTEQEQRDYLEHIWSEERGHGRETIQANLRAGGFANAYVYDAFTVDISTASYDSLSFLFSATSSPHGFDFGDSGRELFIVSPGSDTVHRYSLSIAFDLSTATLNGSFSIGATEGELRDVVIKPGGDAFYVVGGLTDSIREYTMTGYDVTTAVAGAVRNVSAQDANPHGLLFKEDGTRMWMLGYGSRVVVQYDLGTAWDISTAVLDVSISVSAQDLGPQSMVMADRGTKLYVLGTVGDAVYQYSLPTPYDVTGLVYDGLSFDVAVAVPANGSPTGIYLTPYRKLLVMDSADERIYQYSYDVSPIDPRLHTNRPLFGTTQCGDPGTAPTAAVAQCGEEPPDQVSSLSATCNRFLANEVWYLVNDRLTDDAPPPVPDDPNYFLHFWYVGAGSGFGDRLPVSAEERQRFEKLCLRYGPTHHWCVTLIDVWKFSSAWDFKEAGSESGVITWFDGPFLPLPPDGDTDFSIFLGQTDADSVDQSAELSAVVPGDWIRMTLANGEWAQGRVSLAGVDLGFIWEFECDLLQMSPGFEYPASETRTTVTIGTQ